MPAFGSGFITTLKTAALSAVIAGLAGFLSGMFCAYCDLLKSASGKNVRLLRGFAQSYSAVFRGIPLAVLLFTMYYILPFAGLRMSVGTVVILGIGLYHGAYISEILRRSIAAVPEYTRRNACCMGFTDLQVLRHVLLPAASRALVPPLLGALSVIVRNTSVAMIISEAGILGTAESFAGLGTGKYISAYLFAGFTYMMLSLPLTHFAKHAETRVARDPAADIKPGTSGYIKISKGLMEC